MQYDIASNIIYMRAKSSCDFFSKLSQTWTIFELVELAWFSDAQGGNASAGIARCLPQLFWDL